MGFSVAVGADMGDRMTVDDRSQQDRTPRAGRPHRPRRRRLGLLAVGVAVAVLVGACGNSSNKASTAKSTSSTAGGQVAISGVPGVTASAIDFSVLGTRTNNPLGTCILDCFLDGIRSYFDWRNSEGGIYGRKLEVTKDIDDELGQDQVKALEIVSANDTFATFSAVQLANGWAELAKAGIPTLHVGHPPGRVGRAAVDLRQPRAGLHPLHDAGHRLRGQAGRRQEGGQPRLRDQRRLEEVRPVQRGIDQQVQR